LHKLHLSEILGTLKHHVFKEMGKARSVLRFDSESDLVVNAHDNDGGRIIRRENHSQTIIEPVILNRDLESADLGTLGCRLAGLNREQQPRTRHHQQ